VTRRRDYGEGSVYQRCEARYGCPPVGSGPPDRDTGKPTRARHTCRARWYGTIETGWNAGGKRDRVTVSAKSKAECVRRLNKKRRQHEAGEILTSNRLTVKTWAEEYLALRKLPPKPLSPNGWNAAASPIRKWVIPTIGHRRLSELTPANIRAVAQAQYDAGLKTSTADATHRALMTMLNRAVREGKTVPLAAIKTERPGMSPSDRTDLSLADTLACLAVAATLPHGTRWALALLYGARQGELLGLVENDPIDGHPCLDFDAREIRLEWQLQDLQRDHGCNPDGDPTCGRKRAAECPEARWRIHRDYEAHQLRGMYHLVRPKSRKGFRILPMLDPMADALKAWLDVRPANPWGLVYPSAKGRPCNDAVDREEWAAIQYTASVEAVEPGQYAAPLGHRVFHPAGQRFYHVHECRNVAATQLDEVGASDNVITSMLGHAGILTSRGYMTAHLDAKREAVARVAERFGLLPPADESGE
jgi:integrase